MAGERVKLTVQKRANLGSRESRRLRKEGIIPGVLYGTGKQPHAISVQERELRRVLTGDSGLHAILDVVIEDQKTVHPSILKEFQQDPLRGKLVHVDLQEVRLDQPISATVSVTLLGAEESPGVREGGALSQVAREVNVEALPMEIPEHLDLDVSGMEMNGVLRIADLKPVAGVTYLDDPETVLATVTMPTRVEEPEAEAAEGEAAEGEAAEGEAPAEADAASGESGEPGTTEG